MAPGAYNLVLRDLRAAPFLSLYKPFLEEIPVALQQLLQLTWRPDSRSTPPFFFFSHPTLDQVLAFRAYVDRAMKTFIAGRIDVEAVRLPVLRLKDEQQHQELMLTDIKHAFFSNSLRPA